MSDRLKAKFGDRIENGWASEANPTRVGYFVREFTVPRGQMNPGLTWEITDGSGKFWRLKPTGDHKIAVTSAAPSAPAPLSDEVVRLVKAAKAVDTHVLTLDMDKESRKAIFEVVDAVRALAPFADRVGGEAAVDLLAWLAEHRRLELDYGYDDQSEDMFWRVHEVSGSINDREWDLIGQGATPSAALLAAKSFLEASAADDA